MNVFFRPCAGVSVSLTLARLPPRTFWSNAAGPFRDGFSVILVALRAVSRLLTGRKRTLLPAVAPILTRPDRLAVMRNVRLPLRATLARLTR